MEAKELLIEYSSGKDFPPEKTKTDWSFLFGNKASKDFIEIVRWCHPNVKDNIINILEKKSMAVDKDFSNFMFQEQLYRDNISSFGLVAANIFISTDPKFAFTVFARESRKDSLTKHRQEFSLHCLNNLPENQAVHHVIEALRTRATEEKPLTAGGD